MQREEEGLWPTLIAAFHRPKSRAYRVVDVVVWSLIVLSVGLLALEWVLDEASLQVVYLIDRVILVLFAIELGLRVLTHEPPSLRIFEQPPLGVLATHLWGRLAFLLQPSQLIDLLTIVAVVPALRGLRALRLLRLLRTGRVFRYGNPFAGLVAGFETDRMLFAFAFVVLGGETLLGGVSLYLVEQSSPHAQVTTVGEGLWWALVTLTTVGYGDYAPVTGLGRLIAGILMVGGMFTIALFAGIVGHTMLNAVLSIREEQFRMSGYVDHVVVCGYEKGGGLLLRALEEELDLDRTRVVLFGDGDRPHEVPPHFLWVPGDPTKESELDKVRLTHASSVLLVGSRAVPPPQADAVTILTLFTMRAYLARNPASRHRKSPVHLVAEILDSENVMHARTAGADEVIESQALGYSMLSHTIRYPGVGDLTSQVVASGAASFYVGPIPEGAPATFGELCLHVRQHAQALCLGWRDPKSGHQTINPPDDTPVPDGVEVVYLADGPRL